MVGVSLAVLGAGVTERVRADGRFESATVIVEEPEYAMVPGVEDRFESVVQNLRATRSRSRGPREPREPALAVTDLRRVLERLVAAGGRCRQH